MKTLKEKFLKLNESFDTKLSPILDIEVFKNSLASFFGYGALVFIIAALMIPRPLPDPAIASLSLLKKIEVGALKKEEAQNIIPAPSPSVDAVAGLHESSPYGLLPIKNTDGTGIFEAYRLPTLGADQITKATPLIVFDFGLSQNLSTEAIKTLPEGTSFILSPYAQNAQNLISAARQAGFEVWLEIPLQENKNADEGTYALSATLTADENNERLLKNLAIATGYTGLIIKDFNGAFENSPAFEKAREAIQNRGLKVFIASQNPSEIYQTPSKESPFFLLNPNLLKQIQNWMQTTNPVLLPLSSKISTE